MVLPYNNPMVGLATRAWINSLAEQGDVLDPDCAALVTVALEACSRVHPGGMVHDLSVREGVKSELALLAGSVAQLFYAACSATDDLQDGDSGRYFDSTVPLALRLNAQLQLVCAVSLRLEELLAATCTADEAARRVLNPYRVLSIMLTGQRLELTRQPWGTSQYERVARLSAGEQFAFYFSLVAVVAGTPLNFHSTLGAAFGSLLQLVVDCESRDERLTCLPPDEVRALAMTFVDEVRVVAGPIAATAAPVVEHLLGRCLKEWL